MNAADLDPFAEILADPEVIAFQAAAAAREAAETAAAAAARSWSAATSHAEKTPTGSA